MTGSHPSSVALDEDECREKSWDVSEDRRNTDEQLPFDLAINLKGEP